MESFNNALAPQAIDPKLRDSALEAEEKLLGIAGFKPNIDVHAFDVKINFYGDNHLHTIKMGDSNQVNLVLIHGYGGAGIIFYRMLRELAKVYRVFCIDLLGMGLSSRPKFFLEKTEDTIRFFINSIELWREQMGLEKFHLVGHSLGGYFSVHYALKHPQYVMKLTLLSCAGVTKRAETMSEEELLNNMGFFRRNIFKTMLSFWKKKITPHGAFKSLGLIGKGLLKSVIKKRFHRPCNETKWLYKYMKSMYLLPESSEKCVHNILKPPRVMAILPLEDLMKDSMKDLMISCDFYYGEKDWMDRAGSQRLCLYDAKKFNIIEIKYAGHQMIMDNPDEVVQNIILLSKDLVLGWETEQSIDYPHKLA